MCRALLAMSSSFVDQPGFSIWTSELEVEDSWLFLLNCNTDGCLFCCTFSILFWNTQELRWFLFTLFYWYWPKHKFYALPCSILNILKSDSLYQCFPARDVFLRATVHLLTSATSWGIAVKPLTEMFHPLRHPGAINKTLMQRHSSTTQLVVENTGDSICMCLRDSCSGILFLFLNAAGVCNSPHRSTWHESFFFPWCTCSSSRWLGLSGAEPQILLKKLQYILWKNLISINSSKFFKSQFYSCELL